MSKFDVVNFSDTTLKACAKAIAIMAERFVPKSVTYFYSSQYIGEYLVGLPHGSSSSLFADVDFIKLGLMNRSLRLALSSLFPGRFLFEKSQSAGSTISKGQNKFSHGFQIKFLSISSEVSSISKSDIIKKVKDLSSKLYDTARFPATVTPSTNERVIAATISSQIQLTPILGSLANDFDTVVSVPVKQVGSARYLKSKKLLKKLRSSLSYLRSKQQKKIDNNAGVVIRTVGEKLSDLIAEVGVFTQHINGKETLSVQSGVFIQDLISNCGCSMKKIPLIVSIVLTMLFGLIDTQSFRDILRAEDTYALATERTAHLVVKNGRRRFTDREDSDAVLNAFLILDASNKKNKGLVAKPINYVSNDGVVRLGALKMDNTGKREFNRI